MAGLAPGHLLCRCVIASLPYRIFGKLRGLDQRLPTNGFFLQEHAKLIRADDIGRDPEPGIGRLQLRRFQGLVDLMVQAADDLGGNAGRRAEAVPGIGDQQREPLLGQGRHIGQQARPFLRRDAEDAHALVAQKRQDDGRGLKDRLHLVSQQVGHGRTAALVQGDREIHTGQFLEDEGEDMRRRSGRRRECEFWMGFDIVGELARGFHRNVGIDNEQIGRARNPGDREKALDGIVVELLVHGRQDCVRRRGRHQKRVAVGLGPRRGGGADRSAAAGTILDHDRLLHGDRHQLRDQPRRDVGDAARSERHDHPDGAVWIRLRRSRCCERQRQQQGQRSAAVKHRGHGQVR